MWQSFALSAKLANSRKPKTIIGAFDFLQASRPPVGKAMRQRMVAVNAKIWERRYAMKTPNLQPVLACELV